MRLSALCLLLLFPAMLIGQSRKTFLNIRYDQVVMYDFEGVNSDNISIVTTGNKLAASVKKQVILDATTISELNTRLHQKNSFGGKAESCFDPHLGFVYYRQGSIVAFLSICLRCNQLRSSLPVAAPQMGYAGPGKGRYYIAAGLSQPFRAFLNGLMQQHQFSHQIRRGDRFDEE